PRYASICHPGPSPPWKGMSPKIEGRINGELEIENPRRLRGRGPVAYPSPSRSWVTRGLLRHTPVHDPSNRTLPSRGRPTLARLASREPPMMFKPRPVEYAPPNRS